MPYIPYISFLYDIYIPYISYIYTICIPYKYIYHIYNINHIYTIYIYKHYIPKQYITYKYHMYTVYRIPYKYIYTIYIIYRPYISVDGVGFAVGGDDDGSDVAMLRREVMSHAPLGTTPRDVEQQSRVPQRPQDAVYAVGAFTLCCSCLFLSLPIPRDKNWIPVVVI